MKIFKYSLPIKQTKKDRFFYKIPYSATFLALQVQFDTPVMWYLIPDGVTEPHEDTRIFRIFGTGIEMSVEPEDIYLGSFQIAAGHFVGHVFDITRGQL